MSRAGMEAGGSWAGVGSERKVSGKNTYRARLSGSVVGVTRSRLPPSLLQPLIHHSESGAGCDTWHCSWHDESAAVPIQVRARLEHVRRSSWCASSLLQEGATYLFIYYFPSIYYIFLLANQDTAPETAPLDQPIWKILVP